MTKYNKDAMDAMDTISKGIDNMDHFENAVYDAIDIAIQPYEQRLVIVARYDNGIAKLRTIDNTGAICMEWHDVLTTACNKCGAQMDKYNRAGKQYQLCPNCAKRIMRR